MTKAPKMKWFEISVVAGASCMVQAHDEDEAFEFVRADMDNGDLEVDEMKVDAVLTKPEAIERAKRHANFVSEDKERP